MKNVYQYYCCFLLATLLFLSCQTGRDVQAIVFFVPGTLVGSSSYESLWAGLQSIYPQEARLFEASHQQSSWQRSLQVLLSIESPAWLVSSTVSMPSLVLDLPADVRRKTQFLLLDSGSVSGELPEGVFLVAYQLEELAYEMAWFLGRYAQVLWGKDARVAVLLAQHYASFDQEIFPGISRGLEQSAGLKTPILRVLGNWYDTQRAFLAAQQLFEEGVHVIIPIVGSASAGVERAALEKEGALFYFDQPASREAPRSLGSGAVRQDKAIQRFFALDSSERSSLMIWGFEEGILEWQSSSWAREQLKKHGLLEEDLSHGRF